MHVVLELKSLKTDTIKLAVRLKTMQFAVHKTVCHNVYFSDGD